jgi:hypothetical protein
VGSTVTVLVPVLVIKVYVKVESGGVLLDQLAAVDQDPLRLLIH